MRQVIIVASIVYGQLHDKPERRLCPMPDKSVRKRTGAFYAEKIVWNEGMLSARLIANC